MINSFGAGILSRKLDGRTDFEKYYSGCRECLNFIIMPQGGAYCSPGSRFIHAAKNAATAARLIPFDFNATAGESYVIEAGDEYLRFYWGDGLVLDAADAIHELASPWGEDLLPNLRWGQIGDVVYFVCKGVAPYVLTRSGHADWTLASMLFVDGPWRTKEYGDDAIVLTPGNRTGTGVSLAASADLFEAGHEGAPVRLGYVNPDDVDEINWGWGTITAVADAQNATVDIEEALGLEYITDPEFEVGLTGWEEKSTSPSSISHDAANKYLMLNRDASGGYAAGEFHAEVESGVTYRLTVDVAVVGTEVRAYAGSSSGATGYLGVKTMTAAGTYTWEFTPSGEDVYLRLDNANATAGDADAINSVSLAKADFSTNEWRLGAFCEAYGYPEALGWFGERFLMARGRELFGSVPAQFENFAFTSPAEADDGISHKINSKQVSSIKWMVEEENLFVGTNAGEFALMSETEGAIDATEVLRPKRHSSYGSGELDVVQAASRTLYVSNTGKKIRQLTYDAVYYKYLSPEASVLAEHLFMDGVVEMAYAPEPDGILWCVTAGGELLGCTYLPDEKILAWHRHVLGGDAKVESVCCVPGDGYTQVWLLVARRVNGAVVRYVERLAEAFDGTDEYDAADAFMLDCGLSTEPVGAIAAATQASPVQITTAEAHGLSTGDEVLIRDCEGMTELNRRTFTVTVVDATSFTLDGEDGTAYGAFSLRIGEDSRGEVWKMVSTLTGLDHLEGETVQVLADGAVQTDKTVSGGSITLDDAAGIVHVGYAHESILRPMRLEVQTQTGTLQSKRKRVTAVSVRVLHSVGGQIGDGEEPSSWNDIYQWPVPAPAGAPPLFTGDKSLTVAGGWDSDAIVTVRQTAPLPLTVISLVPEIGDVA